MKPSAPNWVCRGRAVPLGDRALVMGVVNVTPDSFSDGGRYLDPAAAVAHGIALAGEGADILDIGGESSRPGAEPVSPEEERRRVIPVVAELARSTSCLLSVDTTKASVAEAAVEAGAHIVNDITALAGDPRMRDVVRATGAGAVLMHMQGTPRTMQDAPRYDDVVAEVRRCLADRVEQVCAGGVSREALVVDPGIGFGKTPAHNVALLARLDELASLRRPVLVGVSRKSFLGHLTGRPVGERLVPSLGALAYAVLRGAHIVRVHDVKESCDVARLLAIFATAQVAR